MQSDNLKKVIILGSLLSAACAVGSVVCISRFIRNCMKDLDGIWKINVRR